MKDNPTVCVIGAGLSGLTAAQKLVSCGITTTVFERGRGPGGRMASRRIGTDTYDHGAQYFTVRDELFQKEVKRWIEKQVVLPWRARVGSAHAGTLFPRTPVETWYVGVPRMSAITRYLASDLQVRFETRIAQVLRSGGSWLLMSETGEDLGRYDGLVIATPPVQAHSLISDITAVSRRISVVKMAPCWAVMASFGTPIEINFDGLFFPENDLSWAARNSSKPGRIQTETWTLHAAHGWSGLHLETSPEEVSSYLLSRFFSATGVEPVRPAHVEGHRWKYALPIRPLGEDCLWYPNMRLALCGDWCQGARAEAAFLSGISAAGLLSARLAFA